VVSWTKGDEEWSNVFHATKTDYTLTDQQSLAAAIDGYHLLANLSRISTAVTYKSTNVYDLRDPGGAIVLNNTNTRIGGNGSEAHAVNLACVVTVRTATRGRSGRGRVYIGGMAENDMDQGSFNAQAAAFALNYVTGIKTAIENAGWTFVIVSRQQNDVTLNPPVARPVTSLIVRSNRPGTQRRRVDRP
jgi:hypothetical protein